MAYGKVLFLQNPGKMSRHWIDGLIAGANRLGIGAITLESESVAAALKADPVDLLTKVNSSLIEHRVVAVVGYAVNAVSNLPPGGGAYYRNFFEIRGIPQLFLWADHPQWVFNKSALMPNLQPAFRTANAFHFLKSFAHGYELRRILGWPNTSELSLGIDTDRLRPATNVKADFDVVAIFGGTHRLPEWALPFLETDSPDPREMNQIVASQLRPELEALWNKDAPPELHPQLIAVGEKLIAKKLEDPTQAVARHLQELSLEFPNAMWWLTLTYPTYFRMTELLWRFRAWQRAFIPAFLAKTFRVGCFGGDWTGVPGVTSAGWVEYDQLPAVFARGEVALNVPLGYDEEGLTAKPFEIAASGRPMVSYVSRGIDAHFARDREVSIFDTPAEARDRVQALLDSPAQRVEMGRAIRARAEKDHTWAHRMRQMLTVAGV